MAELNFILKTTAIYQAVKWGNRWIFKFNPILKTLFFFAFILFASLFAYGFFGDNLPARVNAKLLGLSIIFLALILRAWLRQVFFDLKLKKPRVAFTVQEASARPQDFNLAGLLSFESARAVNKSSGSTALFYYLLADNPKLNFIFSRLLLSSKDIQRMLLKSAMAKSQTGSMERVISESLKIAQKKEHQRIEIGDILAAIVKEEPIFKKIIIDSALKFEDIENLTWWLESLEKRIEDGKRWWAYENLMRKGTLAKEWTAGYTLILDKYSIDWTEIASKRGFPEIIGHQKEIEQAERVLGRREYNNALVVGEPGVGRKAIIQGLVVKSVLGQSLPSVNYKRVVELDLSRLLAEISDVEKITTTLDAIFQEALSAGNVILVINEFHNFIGVRPEPGRMDISGVISPYLSLPNFQVVAVTTFTGLHKNIEQNPSILNLFEKIEVMEVSERESMMILENLTLELEQRYKLFVSYPALREIVALSRRYMPQAPLPKKALDLLDEIMVYVKKSTKDKVVLPSHAAKIISEKTQMPIGDLDVKEKDTLLNLEKLIHQRIINQEEAVTDVSTALRRARAEIGSRSSPMGKFLFLGPTGTGKTETSKALAEIYFGAESRMIRLDMSEFQEVADIARLIGSPGEEGLLTTKVQEDPFSLILLDEIEKAHPSILNLFLQVLDEGHLTDGLGRKVDFKNTIIIATSNAGYMIILDALKQKTEWLQVKQKLLDFVFEKGIFRPEFINRFDAVVVFKPLSKENLLDIAELLLQKLKKSLKEKGIEFIFGLPLKEKIVEFGYNPTFGAREMKRVIQDKIENILASAILSSQVQRGDTIEIDPDFKLNIKA